MRSRRSLAYARSQIGAGQLGFAPEAAYCLVLSALRIGRRAQAIECGLEDWSGVAGVAVDRGDGDDHVEDLFKGEVVAHFASVLR